MRCVVPLMLMRTWSRTRLQSNDPVVRLRTAVAIELPGVADFADLVHVEVGDDEGVLIARRDGEHLAARIAEVALAIKLADVPRRFVADAVDRADEIAVRDGVRRLLELPEIFGESGHGGRGIHHDLGAGETKLARAFGEMAVVADVDADLRVGRLENGVAEVAGAEVELLPETGSNVRDVILAVLAEVGAVGVDDGGGVVVNAGFFFLVQRHDDDHAVLFRVLLHQLRGRTVGDFLDRVVPARALLGAEIRAGENLLHAQHLNARGAGLVDVLERALGLRLANGVERFARVASKGRLDQTTSDDSGHAFFLRFGVGYCLTRTLIGNDDHRRRFGWRRRRFRLRNRLGFGDRNGLRIGIRQRLGIGGRRWRWPWHFD